MLIILSPAKIQNFKPQHVITKYTLPEFIPNAEELISRLRPYSSKELTTLLQVNSEIAKHASDSYYNWNPEHDVDYAKQAMLVYNGEVYRGIDAKTLSADDFDYAQVHLRILSGLYGVLRPLDLIEPYRLEMATKLKNSAGNDLYAFWSDAITKKMQQALKQSGKPEVLLNLASNEYAKAVQFKKLEARVIDFDFLENRNGEYKPITVYMKKARGLMSRYVIQNRIEQVEDLKAFDSEGYWFNSLLSNDNKMVFTRG